MCANSKEIDHWNKWNLGLDASTDAHRDELDQAALDGFAALKIEPGAPVLEIACGIGRLASVLAPRFDYTGVDFAEAAITEAKVRVPKTKFYAADFYEWPAPPKSFAAALFVDAIACMPDQDRAIAKVASLLRPQGTLLITTVNKYVYSRMRWIRPPAEGQVRKWLTQPELFQLLENNGFTVDRCWTVAPGGSMGLLRIVNSRVLNKIANAFLGEKRIRRIKENFGLGQFRLVAAHLRS